MSDRNESSDESGMFHRGAGHGPMNTVESVGRFRVEGLLSQIGAMLIGKRFRVEGC